MIVVALIACGQEDPQRAPRIVADLRATASDSSGVPILTLSHTLEEVAVGRTSAQLLEPDLLVGETGDENDVWFEGLGDVASLGAGGFAVLDPLQAQVVLIDSVGGLVSTLGRKGDGPGEFRDPWAIAAVGEALVVRQNVPATVFTVFRGEAVQATAPAVPDGDWSAPSFRWPRFRMSGHPTGPEDVTRRLQSFGDSSFVHMLQANELVSLDFSDPVEFREGIPTVLIRYDLTGQVVDTVAELKGPKTFVRDIVPGRSIFYVQPLFTARPVWATGAGWYATGHGDSTEVVVKDTAGSQLLRIRFPSRRRPVTEADRMDAADWRIGGFALTNRGDMARVRAGGSSGRRRAREVVLSEILVFNADSIPMVTGAHGTGRCLFLSGFRPEDWQDGTSLTWIAIDVRSPALLGTIRLRPPTDGSLPGFPDYSQYGAAVREFDNTFAFTFRRTEDGAPAVERFPLPFDCG